MVKTKGLSCWSRGGERGLKRAVLASYESEIDPRESADIPWRVLRCLFDQMKHVCRPEFSTQLDQIIESKDVVGYLALGKSVSPLCNGGLREYFAEASLVSFLKKYPFGKESPIDPTAEARKRFQTAEDRCAVTNAAIRAFKSNPGAALSERPAWSLISEVQEKIRGVIGDKPRIAEVLSNARFGPGGCLGVTGSATTTYYKYVADRYTVPHRATLLGAALVLNDQRWSEYLKHRHGGLDSVLDPFSSCDYGVDVVREDRVSFVETHRIPEYIRGAFEVVSHNKITYVPKDARTDRAIAIESHIGVALQLGAGQTLRGKLRRIGLDLSSQATVNRGLALLGSTCRLPIHLRPVTLDLEMASDTLCLETVRLLLPPDWFDLLNQIRAPFGETPEEGHAKRRVAYEKFSSMGNGFTFELETLIFWAVAAVATRRCLGFDSEVVASFGDDMVVPFGAAGLTVELLDLLGFSVNTEKSFFFGPFRESCGEDYFEGTLVRPFFLKRRIKSAKDLIFLHNSLRDHSESWMRAGVLGDTSEVSRVLRDFLPSIVERHLRGPRSEDPEGHLHLAWDEAQTSSFVKWSRDIQCWSYATVRSSPVPRRGRVWGRYLQFLSSVRNADAMSAETDALSRAFAIDVLSKHRSEGGSSGDVVMRDEVQRRVAMELIHRGDWS